jgi:iron complex transport system substrate-binding protein
MRMAGLAAVAFFACCGDAAAVPRHVMSLNLCTDELLLDLAPADRIASVTYLSRSPTDSYFWREAGRVPINHGSAEEVLAQHPDFVLAGTYTTTATRFMLKRIRTPMLEVPPANSFEDIRAVTQSVAHALGVDARGRELLAAMDATLRSLAATKPERVIRVAGWNGGDAVPGRGTLFDAILTAAGGTNIASSTQGARSGSFSIEELLLARPDVLAYGSEENATPSPRTDVDQHPLILKLYANRRIKYPELLYACGIPQSVDAARALRAGILQAVRKPGGAL